MNNFESNELSSVVSCSVGLFGKLQQVMQSEKFTDRVFWKLQNGASPDGKALSNPCCLFILFQKACIV